MPSSARMVFIARDAPGRVVRSLFAIRPSLRQFAIAPGSTARVFAGDIGLKHAFIERLPSVSVDRRVSAAVILFGSQRRKSL
jgi:hypothetical protein